jgi:D-alanine-D-alanine ligase
VPGGLDKPVAKAVLSAAGVATPPSAALPHETFRELGATAVLDALVERLGLPLVVKPTRGGSALGVTVVRDAGRLPGAMVQAFAYGDSALVERHVSGVEVAVSVIDTGDGPQALPGVEICPGPHGYDYAARYTAGTTEYFAPARLDESAAKAAAAAALAAHAALGLRDVSRSDLIIDADGVPWVLEVNVAPGMTETSLLPQAAEAAGLELGALYRDLLAAAHAR